MIESQNEEVISLANGCICCTLVEGFITTLINLLNLASPPDHIVVEASGVADPYKLGQYGHLPGLHLDGVIVVVDAETVRRKARDKYVGDTVARQLQGADLLVLNKTDLVDAETRQNIHTWLQELVPDVRIVEASQGVVPLSLLLGDVGIHERSREPMGSDEHHPDLEYDTWSFTTEEPLDGDVFRALVESLPGGVIRAKGIIYLRENLDQRHIFQLVGKRWSLKAEEPWQDANPLSRLVMVGLPGSIDSDLMEMIAKREFGQHTRKEASEYE